MFRWSPVRGFLYLSFLFIQDYFDTGCFSLAMQTFKIILSGQIAFLGQFCSFFLCIFGEFVVVQRLFHARPELGLQKKRKRKGLKE